MTSSIPKAPMFLWSIFDLSFLMRPCLLKLDHSFLAQLRFSAEAGGHWTCVRARTEYIRLLQKTPHQHKSKTSWPHDFVKLINTSKMRPVLWELVKWLSRSGRTHLFSTQRTYSAATAFPLCRLFFYLFFATCTAGFENMVFRVSRYFTLSSCFSFAVSWFLMRTLNKVLIVITNPFEKIMTITPWSSIECSFGVTRNPNGLHHNNCPISPHHHYTPIYINMW